MTPSDEKRSPDRGDPPEATALSPGQRVGDHFEVVRLLGAGGMGAVYLARDELLGRDVALKLQTGSAGAAEFQRLRREAQALAQLSHPNVVAVHEVGELGEQLFIAMEYVDGWTLDEWLAAQARSLSEILTTFVAAGRGLAAAHAVGLIHRDFKPANVLVGKDGRVRVVDFGMARRPLDVDPPAGPSPLPASKTPGEADSSEVNLGSVTVEGTVVGTPAYMAPEQRTGGELSGRSDQYGFCLSLYEALVGRLPSHATIELNSAGPETGLSFRGPRVRKVPAWLRELLGRGLAKDPGDRFEDMEALLSVLEKTPRRIRTRRLLAGGVVGLVALFALGFGVLPAAVPVCPPASHKLAGVWDPAVRARIATAFEASGQPFAPASLLTTTRSLDAYTANWVATQQDICAATHVRGEQSARALDSRMACMDGLLSHVRALTGVLSVADATVVENAAEAVGTLVPIERCTGPNPKPLFLPVPSSATELARIEGAMADLTGILVQFKAGKHELAQAGLADLERAGLPDHPGVLAKLEFIKASLLSAQGKTGPARAQFEASIRHALASGHDRRLFKSLLELAHHLAFMEKDHRGAERWLSLAEAVMLRLGTPRAMEGTFANDASLVYSMLDRLSDARQQARRCVELGRQGEDELFLTRCLISLSLAQFMTGELASARQTATEALALSVRLVGEEHSTTRKILHNLANYCGKQGDYPAARNYAQRAIASQIKLSGPDSSEVSESYDQLGAYAQEQGDLETARTFFERSHKIKVRKLGPDHLQVGFSLGNRSILSLLSGRLDEALELAERSHRILLAKLGAEHPIMINAHTIEGAIHRERKAFDRSLTSLKRAVELADALLPAEHPARANPRVELAKTELDRGQAARALALTRQAEKMCATGKVAPREVADNQFLMARALWASGGDRTRAVALAQQARDAWAKMEITKELAAADAWLAAHPVAGTD